LLLFIFYILFGKQNAVQHRFNVTIKTDTNHRKT